MKIDFLKKIFWVIILLITWQIIYLLNIFNSGIFPSIVDITNSLISSIISGEIVRVILYSLTILISSLLLGFILALIVSALRVSSEIFDSFLSTCVAIAHPLPAVALLPLFFMTFGFGNKTIIMIIFHSVFWPLVVNISTGFKSVNKIHLQVGQNMELCKWDTAVHIFLPSSMPYILSGLKVAWARSWRALIGAEMIFGVVGNIGGLGWLIHKQRVFMDTSGLYSSLFIIILIGVLIESLLFNRLETKTIKKWGMTR